MADDQKRGSNPNADQNLTDEDQSKGGQHQGAQNNPGNFANRPEEDVENAAQEGGESSQGGGRSTE